MSSRPDDELDSLREMPWSLQCDRTESRAQAQILVYNIYSMYRGKVL